VRRRHAITILCWIPSHLRCPHYSYLSTYSNECHDDNVLCGR